MYKDKIILNIPPNLFSVVTILSTLVGLAGCSAIKRAASPDEHVTTFSGSGTIFYKGDFSKLNLCNLLIRFGLAEVKTTESGARGIKNAINIEDSEIVESTDIAEVSEGKTSTINVVSEVTPGFFSSGLALPEQICVINSGVANSALQAVVTEETMKKGAGTKITKTTTQSVVANPEFEAKRNNFVSYVMALSEQKCGVYKSNLLRERAEFSTLMGGLSTLFAGTSAVLSHGLTASAFAAGAGVSSGINAVYAQERFANLTVEVITAGIDQRRKELEDAVIDKFKTNLNVYPVGYAIKDALSYHAACTAVTGLEVAKNSITRIDDPGIRQFEQFNKALKGMGMKLGVKEEPVKPTDVQPPQPVD